MDRELAPFKGALTNIPDEVDDNLVRFIETLEEIDETKPIARLNAISIVGRNGGRIYF